ncbi:unnamed protein product [Lampetra planeri]
MGRRGSAWPESARAPSLARLGASTRRPESIWTLLNCTDRHRAASVAPRGPTTLPDHAVCGPGPRPAVD